MFQQIEEPYFDYCVAGPFSVVTSEIRHKLGQFKRFAVDNYKGKIKIGATNNPDVRWSQHKNESGWCEMIVLWETSS